MKRFTVALGLLAAVSVVGYVLTTPAITAPPKPSEYPVSWQLDIDYQAPRPIMVTEPGQTKPKLFWYMTYVATNNTNEEQMFVPSFTLYTDTGEILPAGRNVPAAVVQAIRKLHRNPLLQEVSAVTGTILRGEDNAKDGVAIWPDFDPKAGKVDIFVGGLSGEVAVVKLPQGTTIKVTEPDGFGHEKTVDKDQIILSKTLRLRYSIPGEAKARPSTPATFVEKEWLMR